MERRAGRSRACSVRRRPDGQPSPLRRPSASSSSRSSATDHEAPIARTYQTSRPLDACNRFGNPTDIGSNDGETRRPALRGEPSVVLRTRSRERPALEHRASVRLHLVAGQATRGTGPRQAALRTPPLAADRHPQQPVPGPRYCCRPGLEQTLLFPSRRSTDQQKGLSDLDGSRLGGCPDHQRNSVLASVCSVGTPAGNETARERNL